MAFQRPVNLLACVASVLLSTTAGAVTAGQPDGDSHRSIQAPSIDKPLLAHWTFNESGSTPSLDAEADRNVPRTRGVHGNALQLTGQHALKVTGVVPADGISQITLSAWARPTDLSGYREIFRQECSSRVLFSFQGSGSILSLGLNVGGYHECDAQINPANLLDGQWHHCAATFDGKAMRVYLDGKLIGSAQRPGTIATEADVPAFIGSSGGSGEFFQGSLDDLRIYREALSDGQIAELFRGGTAALAKYFEQMGDQVGTVYERADSLAETLAACRRKLVEQSGGIHPELLGAVQVRLRADFPDQYNDFVRLSGMGLPEYLTSSDIDLPRRVAGRLVGLASEYKPLTDHQWASQTALQRRHWLEVQRIERAYEDLVAAGAAAAFSPGWIEIILQAGPMIQLRPKTSEAVAPYVQPTTTETRDLTADEARQALQRDWLHQADGNPTPERIASEIDWTRQLAERISRDHPGAVDFAGELAELEELQRQVAKLDAADHELYFAVRRIKRQIVLSNPVVDFDKVLLVDMPFPAGSEWRHETRHRLGFMAVPGGRLLILEGLGPEGHLRQLAPQAPLHGSFWRPDLSYDARKVLFCFKPHNEKAFHLYEVNVDGSGLVQLTDGPFDDLDPIYLPDGRHIFFSTTRGHTYVRCMPPTNAYLLARCDRSGENIYLISRNNEPDYLPSVMNDGRIIYTRWEYTDKPLWRAQSLWTVNPDGTQVNTFWGNQSVWPDLLKDARCIPGSRRVMFTGSAHHNWFSGSVGIIDPTQGLNFPHGLTKVTADVSWPESGNGPVDPVESADYHAGGHYAAYYSPYPLSEREFIVSADRGGKFVLYLMDVDGNRELIYEGVKNIFHAQPVRPRPKPPVVTDRVAWPTRRQRLDPQDGIIFSADVYQGAPTKLQGKAKYLRVLNIDPKTYTYWHKRPYLSTGPVVSAVQSDGVKRILGTVPIETDGSVAFYAPPGKALHFQLLDENYRALQTMRSFTGVMPGERRGCLGCHEMHSATPPHKVAAVELAAHPSKITPPPWGVDTVGYMRYVQPVLDRYCGQCHQGEGKAREVLDLTLRPGFSIFTEPYVTLIGRPTWGSPYKEPEKPKPGWGIADMIMVEGYDTRDPAGYQTPEPMTKLSYKSRLVALCAEGKHYDVKVDPLSLRRVIAWVDTMCPYRGREEVCELPDPQFQGVDWLSIRPKIKSAPEIVRPGPLD